MSRRSRKRIGVDLLVLSQFSFTGVVTYAQSLLPPLFEAMHECEWVLFVKSPGDVPAGWRRFENVRVKHSPWMRSDLLWKLAGLTLEAFRERLDLLFVPVSRAPLWKTCPLVVTLHDLGFRLMPEYLKEGTVAKTHLAFKHATSVADAFLAGSQFTKSEIMNAYPVPAKKIWVTNYGYDGTAFSPERTRQEEAHAVLQRYGIRQPFVLYLGVIQGRKNLVKLIEASHLWRQSEPGLQLVLAGKKGWNCDPVYAAASGHPLSEINLPGPIRAEDLKAVYQQAECFVLPSLYESFGIPVVEAMACGTPVVLSTAAALPEVGGDAALYFDPSQPEEIAQKILQLKTVPGLRERLVEAGYARASQFTWSACALGTERAFHSLLGPLPGGVRCVQPLEGAAPASKSTHPSGRT